MKGKDELFENTGFIIVIIIILIDNNNNNNVTVSLYYSVGEHRPLLSVSIRFCPVPLFYSYAVGDQQTSYFTTPSREWSFP